jgi:hypothetical protein
MSWWKIALIVVISGGFCALLGICWFAWQFGKGMGRAF